MKTHLKMKTLPKWNSQIDVESCLLLPTTDSERNLRDYLKSEAERVAENYQSKKCRSKLSRRTETLLFNMYDTRRDFVEDANR
ncbi:MAG: hypothetical protein R3C20_04730 [Planctomycetaceae bacterium]